MHTRLAVTAPYSVPTRATAIEGPIESALARLPSIITRPNSVAIMPKAGPQRPTSSSTFLPSLMPGLHGLDFRPHHFFHRFRLDAVDRHLDAQGHERIFDLFGPAFQGQQAVAAGELGQLDNLVDQLRGRSRACGRKAS